MTRLEVMHFLAHRVGLGLGLGLGVARAKFELRKTMGSVAISVKIVRVSLVSYLNYKTLRGQETLYSISVAVFPFAIN